MNTRHLPGFTPVRRREQDLPFLSPAGPTAPWTATRCHRLLRPIISRLELLRKEVKNSHHDCGRRGSSAVETEDVIPDDAPAPKRRKQERGPEKPRQPAGTDVAGPDWLLGQDAGRNCRTKYSARARQRPAASSRRPYCGIHTPARSRAPGQLTVPTPMLVRAHASRHPVELGCDGPEDNDRAGDDIQFEASKLPGKRKPRQNPSRDKAGLQRVFPFESLRGSVSNTTWPLYTGLYTATEALLKACSMPSRARIAGARSLFSTCLRQIPGFIAEEQRWLEAEAQSSGRISSRAIPKTDIYTELETARSVNGRGWKPLRQVVKAEAFHLICDAIHDHLVHAEYASALASLCIMFDSFDEAELIIDALIAADPPPRTPSSIKGQLFSADTSPALSALASYAELSGRRSYQYRRLASLLRQGEIGAEWLAMKDCLPLWDMSIKSTCDTHNYNAEAWEFLEAALCAALELPTDEENTQEDQNDQGRMVPVDPMASIHYTSTVHSDQMVKNRTEPGDAVVKETLDETIVSLIELISALAILGSGKETSSTSSSSDNSYRIARCLAGVVMLIQRKILLHRMDDVWFRRVGRRLATTLLAGGLVSTTVRFNNVLDADSFRQQAISTLGFLLDSRRTDTSRILSRADEPLMYVEGLVESIHTIARCCDRATPGNAPTYIKSLVETLGCLVETAVASNGPWIGKGILSQVIVKTVSRYSNDSELGEWATDIQARFAPNCPNPGLEADACFVREPPAREMKPSAGWGDELCEQFAKTPKISTNQRRRDSVGSVSSDDTPRVRRLLAGPHQAFRLQPKLSSMLLGKTPSPFRLSRDVRQLPKIVPLHQSPSGVRSVPFVAHGKQRPPPTRSIQSSLLSTAAEKPIKRSKPGESRESKPSHHARLINQAKDRTSRTDSDSGEETGQSRPPLTDGEVTLSDLSCEPTATRSLLQQTKPTASKRMQAQSLASVTVGSRETSAAGTDRAIPVPKLSRGICSSSGGQPHRPSQVGREKQQPLREIPNLDSEPSVIPRKPSGKLGPKTTSTAAAATTTTTTITAGAGARAASTASKSTHERQACRPQPQPQPRPQTGARPSLRARPHFRLLVLDEPGLDSEGSEDEVGM